MKEHQSEQNEQIKQMTEIIKALYQQMQILTAMINGTKTSSNKQ